MKKTFLAKRNTLLSSKSLSWGALALLAVLLILLIRILAPNFFWVAFAPLYGTANALSAGSSALVSGFGDTIALAERNNRLTEENASLANENRALFQKVAALETLIGSSNKQENSVSGIFAGVVARPPQSPYDTFVLAAGKNKGVVLGMEAFGPGGVPLGVVSSVLDDFSRVTLFSAPGVTVNGWVGDRSLPLTLEGSGAGTFQAISSRAANIAAGDAVFVPGPGALPVGSIMRIDSDPSAPSVTVRIKPAVNIFSITWVVLRDTGALFSGVPLGGVPTP